MSINRLFVPALLLLAAASAEAGAAAVRFAGRDWLVAEGPCQSGNVCAPGNVWVDGEGLHLRLSTTPAGEFRAAAVESADYTRYGMHRFYVRGPIADLHRNVVLGLFTFRNRKDLRDNDFIDADLIPQGEGEIDIELTKWGDGTPGAANSHFTVQEGPPPPPAGNSSSNRFELGDCSGTDCYTTHYFDWSARRIRFKSFRGHSPEPPKGPGWSIHQWEYPRPYMAGKAVPREALPKIIMNLYRAAPEDTSPGQVTEIIITDADLPIERVPVISTDSVRAVYGDTDSGFYFSAAYYDPDGDSPAVRQLNIGGAVHEMSLVSGSPSDGTYRFGPVAAVRAGMDYFFTFSDGHGGSARLPESGSFRLDTAR